MTRCALAPVLARFIEQAPQRRACGWWRATAPRSTEQVLAGELEFAIVPAFSGAAGLKSRLFLRTPELLVAEPPLGADTISRRCGSPISAPLKLVVPSKANTRRRLIETYLASNGVADRRGCSSSTPCWARSTSSPAPTGSRSCRR